MEEKEKCTCNHECEETCNCDESCNCTENCKCEDSCKCSHEHVDKKEKKKKNKKDKELEDALNLINELNDKLLREKAELVNYRRRKDEEVSKMLKFANEDLVTEILPIIDNFESAIKMDTTKLNEDVVKFLEGFKMIYCNLLTILEKYDVKPIDGNNKPFDPTYHQAVMTEASDMDSGMIIEVLRKGYILKGKVLRPAMVKVSE